MQRVYFRTGTSGSVGYICTSDGRIDFSELAELFKLDPKSILLNGILFRKEGLKSESKWEDIEKLFKEDGICVGTKDDPVVVTAIYEAAVPAVSTGKPPLNKSKPSLQASGALRQVLEEKCPDAIGIVEGDDISTLIAAGFFTTAAFASATEKDLFGILPGRPALVRLLLKAFVQPAGLRPANAAELPSAGAGQATPEQDDRLQRLLEGFVKMMTERFEVVARKKSYRISEANSTVFQEIQSSGGVEGIDSVEVLFDARKHNLRNVPIFKWGNGVESGQAVRYVKYVKQHLVQSNQKWSVINGNQHPRLLDGNVRGNGEGTVFKGTTDVVVVEKAAEDLPETGLKIIFELKKDGTIDKRAEYQTIVSLLLANNTCRRLRPVAVLTDLGNMWKFFYCDHSTVYRHTFPSSKEAVGYLDAILKDDIEQDDSHDTSALRSPGESSLRGVKRSFSGRRKFSTPALEQLEELAGFLPEDELRQGRAAIALQCALNIPAFYSVVSDLRESPEGMCLRGR